MKKHYRYLKYVLKHKWEVFKEACKLGIPIRGILHDLSKFRLSEWSPYVEKFYGEQHAENCGFSMSVDMEFDKAWLQHQHRNKHHWQHWVLREDSGNVKLLPMPLKYVKELVADWRGANRAQGGNGTTDTIRWYEEHKNKLIFHPLTRMYVEQFVYCIPTDDFDKELRRINKLL